MQSPFHNHKRSSLTSQDQTSMAVLLAVLMVGTWFSTSPQAELQVLPWQIEIQETSRQELQSLPGIGPKRAGHIWQHLWKSGGFNDPKELLSIPGIGLNISHKLQKHFQHPENLRTESVAKDHERTGK